MGGLCVSRQFSLTAHGPAHLGGSRLKSSNRRASGGARGRLEKLGYKRRGEPRVALTAAANVEADTSSLPSTRGEIVPLTKIHCFVGQ